MLALDTSDLLSSTMLSFASSGEVFLDPADVSDARRVLREGVFNSASLTKDDALVDRLGVAGWSGVARFVIEECFLPFADTGSGDLPSGASEDALVARFVGVFSWSSETDIRLVLTELLGVEVSSLPVDIFLVLFAGVLTSVLGDFDGKIVCFSGVPDTLDSSRVSS